MIFKKYFFLVLTVGFAFYTNDVLSSIPSDEAIYFCTRDLNTPLSQAGIEEENIKNEYIKVIPNIENSKNSVLRHCFMMRAEKMTSKDSRDYLKSHMTMGFFYDPNIDEAIYTNEELSGQVISCTSVRLIDKDKGEKGLLVWSNIANFYEEEVLKGYSNFNHNCCTVAYNSISSVDGDNSAIDPRTFNFRVGIRWKFENLGSSSLTMSQMLPFFLPDQLSYTVEKQSSSSQNSEDDKNSENDKKKDEL